MTVKANDATAQAVNADWAEDCHEQHYLRQFVEQYLTSRGYHVCSRNVRVIVAAIADCRPTALDWASLERVADGAVNPELLRRAA